VKLSGSTTRSSKVNSAILASLWMSINKLFEPVELRIKQLSVLPLEIPTPFISFGPIKTLLSSSIELDSEFETIQLFNISRGDELSNKTWFSDLSGLPASL